MTRNIIINVPMAYIPCKPSLLSSNMIPSLPSIPVRPKPPKPPMPPNLLNPEPATLPIPPRASPIIINISPQKFVQ